MRISKVIIKNMFGIKEKELDGKDVELTGDNGTGKTSVIDAIKHVLKNKSDREYIIREGSDEGEIIIETDTGLMIHRKVRTDKADYKVVKENGKLAQDDSEKRIRTIFTELQLNPVEFLKMDKNEQNRILLDLIDFKWDMAWIEEQFGEIPPEVEWDQNILNILHQIQAEDGYYFLKRQDLNREARNKKAFIEEIAADMPKDYNVNFWRKYDVEDVYTRLEKIRARNNIIEKAKETVSSVETKMRSFDADRKISINAVEKATSDNRTNIEKTIIDLKNQLAQCENDLKGLEKSKISKIENIENKYRADVAEFKAQLDECMSVSKEKPKDTTALQQEATTAKAMISHIREYDRMCSLDKDVMELVEYSEHLTAKIEKARDLPGEILQNCDIPVDNLSIVDGVPLINGLPVSNLSEGEKLDLCVDIALHNADSLNLLLIDGVETLSEQNRKKLYKKCKSKGVQIIATRTTNDNELLITEI